MFRRFVVGSILCMTLHSPMTFGQSQTELDAIAVEAAKLTINAWRDAGIEPIGEVDPDHPGVKLLTTGILNRNSIDATTRAEREAYVRGANRGREIVLELKARGLQGGSAADYFARQRAIDAANARQHQQEVQNTREEMKRWLERGGFGNPYSE